MGSKGGARKALGEMDKSPQPVSGLRNRRKCLAYLITCFPNVIETMIYREIAGLRALHYEIRTISIRRPSPADIPPEAWHAAETTHYIRPVDPVAFAIAHATTFLRQPVRYLRLLIRLLTGKHTRHRDRFRTLGHFAEAVAVVPTVQRMRVDHIHAHWATGSATCAMVVSELLGIPFSFTAHAYDIWRNNDKLLIPQKLSQAQMVFTCTDYNRRHFIEHYAADPTKVHVAYHGLDLGQFTPPPARTKPKPVILAVARLVEQKGLAHLLRACSLLAESGHSFQCEVVGDGPLRRGLETLAKELGLTEHVHFRGQLYQEELLRYYETADIFALPCVQASDNDRDGIPNTMLEACAMQLPIVSTSFSGIPELVEHGINGLLVKPSNVNALAAALECLLKDPSLREAMGKAGRARIQRDFTLQAAARRLDSLFSDGCVQPYSQSTDRYTNPRSQATVL